MAKPRLVSNTSPLLYIIGTLGILLKAKRVGLISMVRPLLVAAQHAGFRLDKTLYDEALNLAGESSYE